MSKIKENIGFIAALLSIASICVSIYSYVHVDKFMKMVEDLRPLEMDIVVERPQDGSDLTDYIAEIGGQISLKSSSNSSHSDINLELAKRNIDIIPMVRPLSETNIWFAQTKLPIRGDGSFKGSVNIGDKEGRGIGIRFQVVVIAVPEGTIRQGDKFSDLPKCGASSKVVTYRRIHK